MKYVLLDTSALYALTDNRDPDHIRIADYIRTVDKTTRLVVTNHVLDEALTLIKVRLGAHVALVVGNRLRGGNFCRLVHLSPDDEEVTWRLFQRYHDRGWSYTDCSCLAVMRRLDIQEALTTDPRFHHMGITVVP